MNGLQRRLDNRCKCIVGLVSESHILWVKEEPIGQQLSSVHAGSSKGLFKVFLHLQFNLSFGNSNNTNCPRDDPRCYE